MLQLTTCISSLNVSGITILSNNAVIGGSAAKNILQVGNAGRLKVGSGASDYSSIGTLDTDDKTTNSKIFINGNTCNSAGAPGCIPYFATSANGAHVFYCGSPVGENLRIDGGDSISCTGCGKITIWIIASCITSSCSAAPDVSAFHCAFPSVAGLQHASLPAVTHFS